MRTIGQTADNHLNGGRCIGGNGGIAVGLTDESHDAIAHEAQTCLTILARRAGILVPL